MRLSEELGGYEDGSTGRVVLVVLQALIQEVVVGNDGIGALFGVFVHDLGQSASGLPNEVQSADLSVDFDDTLEHLAGDDLAVAKEDVLFVDHRHVDQAAFDGVFQKGLQSDHSIIIALVASSNSGSGLNFLLFFAGESDPFDFMAFRGLLIFMFLHTLGIVLNSLRFFFAAGVEQRLQIGLLMIGFRLHFLSLFDLLSLLGHFLRNLVFLKVFGMELLNVLVGFALHAILELVQTLVLVSAFIDVLACSGESEFDVAFPELEFEERGLHYFLGPQLHSEFGLLGAGGLLDAYV